MSIRCGVCTYNRLIIIWKLVLWLKLRGNCVSFSKATSFLLTFISQSMCFPHSCYNGQNTIHRPFVLTNTLPQHCIAHCIASRCCLSMVSFYFQCLLKQFFSLDFSPSKWHPLPLKHTQWIPFWKSLEIECSYWSELWLVGRWKVPSRRYSLNQSLVKFYSSGLR